jgi:hypothetical protein
MNITHGTRALVPIYQQGCCHLSPCFRPENSDVGYQQAKEAADFSGLAVEQLCALKVERLVAHEVLIRVTADLSVPDGPSYEYLGLQLRGMVDTIYRRYMIPKCRILQPDLILCGNAPNRN